MRGKQAGRGAGNSRLGLLNFIVSMFYNALLLALFSFLSATNMLDVL